MEVIVKRVLNHSIYATTSRGDKRKQPRSDIVKKNLCSPLSENNTKLTVVGPTHTQASLFLERAELHFCIRFCESFDFRLLLLKKHIAYPPHTRVFSHNGDSSFMPVHAMSGAYDGCRIYRAMPR